MYINYVLNRCTYKTSKNHLRQKSISLFYKFHGIVTTKTSIKFPCIIQRPLVDILRTTWKALDKALMYFTIFEQF